MTRPQAVVLDPIRAVSWSYEYERTRLDAAGVELVVPEDTAPLELIATCDVLISSGRVPVTAELLAAAATCCGVLCYSAGRNVVDEVAAARAGIRVASIHAATDDVADHAWALLLAMTRRLFPLAASADRGVWDLALLPEIWTIPRLAGGTLGVVGAGHIGKAIAARGRAFGMVTVANHHHPPDPADPLLPHVALPELFATSDVVVLAAALTPETTHLVDHELLHTARHGLLLVNIARGMLIDEDALADALDEGIIGGAALDVRSAEPPDPATDRLTGHPRVIQTPHVGGASVRSHDALHRHAAAGVLELLRLGNRLAPTPHHDPPSTSRDSEETP